MSVYPRRQGSLGTGLSITLTPDKRPDEVLLALYTSDQVKKAMAPVEARMEAFMGERFDLILSTLATERLHMDRVEGGLSGAIAESRAHLIHLIAANHREIMRDMANMELRFAATVTVLCQRIEAMERRTLFGLLSRARRRLRYLWWMARLRMKKARG